MLELIHTSAEKGLKDGSSGFCSVAWTEGIPASFIPILEQMSGYKVIHDPTGPMAKLNPVAYIFMRKSMGGRSQAIISRLCANGVDYTGRANKIAHHIVMTPEEEEHATPIDYCLAEENFYKQWIEEPHILGFRRPHVGSLPSHTPSWLSLTGDSNWSNAIADIFLKTPDQAIFVVTPPELNVLPLIKEITDKLPLDKAWNFSFNTYFIGLTPGSSCFLRFCLEDSEALKMAQRRQGTIVINLINKSLNKPAPYIEKTATKLLNIVEEEEKMNPAPPQQLDSIKHHFIKKQETTYKSAISENQAYSKRYNQKHSKLPFYILIVGIFLLIGGGLTFILLKGLANASIPPPPPPPVENQGSTSTKPSTENIPSLEDLLDEPEPKQIEPPTIIDDNIPQIPTKDIPIEEDSIHEVVPIPEVKKDTPKMIEKQTPPTRPLADELTKETQEACQEWWDNELKQLRNALTTEQFNAWNHNKKFTIVAFPDSNHKMFQNLKTYAKNHHGISFIDLYIENPLIDEHKRSYFKIAPTEIAFFGIQKKATMGTFQYSPTTTPCAKIILNHGVVEWIDEPFYDDSAARITPEMINSITFNNQKINFEPSKLPPLKLLEPVKITIKNGADSFNDSLRKPFLKNGKISVSTKNAKYKIKLKDGIVYIEHNDLNNFRLARDLYALPNKEIPLQRKKIIISRYLQWLETSFKSKNEIEDPVFGKPYLDLFKKKKSNQDFKKEYDNMCAEFSQVESIRRTTETKKKKINELYEKIRTLETPTPSDYFEKKYHDIINSEVELFFKQKDMTP